MFGKIIFFRNTPIAEMLRHEVHLDTGTYSSSSVIFFVIVIRALLILSTAAYMIFGFHRSADPTYKCPPKPSPRVESSTPLHQLLLPSLPIISL